MFSSGISSCPNVSGVEYKLFLWLGKSPRLSIRRLLGFLPKVQGQKTACAKF
jgi:hypothetical protein